jgi:ankyrin repeat protein
VVWNVAGVRSFEAKIKAQLQRASRIDDCNEPMIWAAEYGNLPAIRAILQSGVDVNMTYSTWRKRTGLHLASEFDHMDAVKLLLEAGADPNIQIEGYTALNWHLASVRHEQNPLLVRALIQAGTDVKIPSNRLSTPLHFTDCAACAMMLIDAGADINAVNKKGQSPLRHAILDNRPAVERLLRRFNALDIGP